MFCVRGLFVCLLVKIFFENVERRKRNLMWLFLIFLIFISDHIRTHSYLFVLMKFSKQEQLNGTHLYSKHQRFRMVKRCFMGNEQYLSEHAAKMREYRISHRIELSKWTRFNINRRWKTIVQNAQNRGLVIELTKEYYHQFIAHEPCFYCGQSSAQTPFIVMDRQNNSIGYMITNATRH